MIKCFKIEQLLNVCNVNFTVSHSKLPQNRNFSRKTETTACHSPLDLINLKQFHNSTIVFLNRQPHKNSLLTFSRRKFRFSSLNRAIIEQKILSASDDYLVRFIVVDMKNVRICCYLVNYCQFEMLDLHKV